MLIRWSYFLVSSSRFKFKSYKYILENQRKEYPQTLIFTSLEYFPCLSPKYSSGCHLLYYFQTEEKLWDIFASFPCFVLQFVKKIIQSIFQNVPNDFQRIKTSEKQHVVRAINHFLHISFRKLWHYFELLGGLDVALSVRKTIWCMHDRVPADVSKDVHHLKTHSDNRRIGVESGSLFNFSNLI